MRYQEIYKSTFTTKAVAKDAVQAKLNDFVELVFEYSRTHDFY